MFIGTSDWHLRHDKPKCRTDNFESTQWEKVEFIFELAKKKKLPIIVAGDLFHKAETKERVANKLAELINKYKVDLFVCAGNHDLPAHNFDRINESTLGLLYATNTIRGLKPSPFLHESGIQMAPWGTPIERIKELRGITLVWHIMTWTGRSPWPGCKNPSAHTLIKECGHFRVILTGDNHKPFVVKEGETILVNPGSLTRQTADQMKHKPRVYIIDPKKLTAIPVYIPINENVITKDHIDVVKNRDARIDAFVENLGASSEYDLSFSANLDRFCIENNIKKPVVTIAHECIEGRDNESN